MKIYETGNNIIPKLVCVFMTPLWAVPLSLGMKYSSLFWVLLGVLLLVVSIWTFMGKSQRYVDSLKKKVITEKQWLWFTWGDETSLSNYKHLALVDYCSTNGTGSGPASVYWHVNLVGKYSGSNATGGFDNNINLKSFDSKKYTKEAALSVVEEIASELDMKVIIETNLN